jgi:hypothetical protein
MVLPANPPAKHWQVRRQDSVTRARHDIFRVSHVRYRLGNGHSDGQEFPSNFGRFVPVAVIRFIEI